MTDEEKYQRVKNEILESITGTSKILFWGFTPDCIRLISDLHSMGLSHYIEGITDHNPSRKGLKIYNLEVMSPEKIQHLKFDLVVIMYDLEKEEALKIFSEIDGRLAHIILYGNKNYEFYDSCFREILASLPVKPMAHGYPFMLIHMYQSLQYIIRSNIEGYIVEFGTFQGGTTVFIAEVLRMLGDERKIYSFDTFSGYPPRGSPLDLFSEKKCEFRDVDFVQTYCKRYNIEIVKGDIVDNIHVLKGKKFAFSFFDTDNYTPTRMALELVFENTSRGGILAFDHYYSENWIKTIGERMAAREVLQNRNVFHLHGTGIFMKM